MLGKILKKIYTFHPYISVISKKYWYSTRLILFLDHLYSLIVLLFVKFFIRLYNDSKFYRIQLLVFFTRFDPSSHPWIERNFTFSRLIYPYHARSHDGGTLDNTKRSECTRGKRWNRRSKRFWKKRGRQSDRCIPMLGGTPVSFLTIQPFARLSWRFVKNIYIYIRIKGKINRSCCEDYEKKRGNSVESRAEY